MIVFQTWEWLSALCPTLRRRQDHLCRIVASCYMKAWSCFLPLYGSFNMHRSMYMDAEQPKRWQHWLLLPLSQNSSSRFCPVLPGLGSCQAYFSFTSSLSNRLTHRKHDREAARLQGQAQGCTSLCFQRNHSNAAPQPIAGSRSVVLESAPRGPRTAASPSPQGPSSELLRFNNPNLFPSFALLSSEQ